MGTRVGRHVHILPSSPRTRRQEGSEDAKQKHIVHLYLNQSTPVAEHSVIGPPASLLDSSLSSTALPLSFDSALSGGAASRERSATDDRPSSPAGSLSQILDQLPSPGKIGSEQPEELPPFDTRSSTAPRLGNVDGITESADDSQPPALKCTPPRVLPPLEQTGEELSVCSVPVPSLLSELSVDELIRNAPTIAAR